MSLIVYKKDVKKKKVVFASDGIELGDYEVYKNHMVKMLYDECTNTCIGATGEVYVINHLLNNFNAIISKIKDVYKETVDERSIIANEQNIAEIIAEVLSDNKFDIEGSDYSVDCLILFNGKDLYSISTYKNLKQVEADLIEDDYYAIGYGRDYALGALDCGASVDKAFDTVRKRTVSINETIKKIEFNYE